MHIVIVKIINQLKSCHPVFVIQSVNYPVRQFNRLFQNRN